MSTATRVAGGVSLAAVVAAAVPFIAEWEGLRLDPYDDLAHVRTVCYGETQGVEERRYSKAECDAMLVKAVERHARPIRACIPADTPLMAQVAFASMGYNIGVANFCGSITARRARARDFAGACAAIPRWNKVKVSRARCPYTPAPGKDCLVVSKGLDNRRAAERALCEQGLAALRPAVPPRS
ncbi:lysozyme [Phenylobacterium sp.]|uniref:lysozyme n=1 Tax=Phenylobacterium sp. TaxID=1871053 RepID=UPI0035AF4016